MPLTQEDIQFLQSQGIDPNSGQIVESPNTGMSGPQAVGSVLKGHAGGILGGGAGALGGTALAAALAPESFGASLLIPLVGALAGGYLGQKGQQTIESPQTIQQQQQNIQEAYQQHPFISGATDIGASALASGGMFSPTTPLRAARGLVGLLGRQGISDVDRAALLNTGMQAGINPAIQAGISLVQTGQLPSGGDLLTSALGGALFAKPSALGRWAMRPSVNEPVPPELLNEQRQQTEPVKETPFTQINDNGQYTVDNTALKQIWKKYNPKPNTQGMNYMQAKQAESAWRNNLAMPIRDIREALHQKFLNGDFDPQPEPLALPEKSESTLQEERQKLFNLPEKSESTQNEEFLEREKEHYQQLEQELNQQREPAEPLAGQHEPYVKPEGVVISPDILDKLIANKAGTPQSVQRIFPGLKLSREEAQYLLDQANSRRLGGEHIGSPENENPNNDVDEYNRLKQEQQNLIKQGKHILPDMSGFHPDYLANWKQMEAIKNRQPNAGHLPEGASGRYETQVPIKQSEVPKTGRILLPVGIQEHILRGNAVVGTALHSLANTPGHEYAPLTKELLKIARPEDLKVPIQGNADKSSYRHFLLNPDRDFIGIAPEHMGNASVLMEEILHALSVRKIREIGAGGMYGEKFINHLENYAKDGANPHLKDLVQSYLQTLDHYNLREYLRHSIGNSHNVADVLRNNPVSGISGHSGYYLGSLEEFLAAAFHDRSFQQRLNEIKTTGGKSVWQKIIDAITHLLGIPVKQQSMLERVLKTGSEIISEGGPNAIQEQSTSSLFPRTQERTGETGSGRERMGQGEQGFETTETQENRTLKPSSSRGNKEIGNKVEPENTRFLGKFGDFFKNTIQRAREVSPQVADAYHRFFNERSELYGQVFGRVKSVMDKVHFTRQDGKRLMEAARWEELHKQEVPKTFFNNDAQRAVWNEYKKVYREQGEQAIQDRQPVYDPRTKQYRIRRLNDISHPLMMNPAVSSILRENVNKPEIAKLTKDFIDNQLAHGATPQQAKENLEIQLAAIRGNTQGVSDVGNQNYFNANRRAMGMPLPESWQRQDFESNLRTYASRNASDRAHFKHIESNPDVMQRLGERYDSWGRPIEPDQSKDVVAGNKYIQTLMRESKGEVGPQGFYTERAGSSAATALFISSPALSGVHVPISNLVGAVGLTDNPFQASRLIWQGLKGISKGYVTANKNGIMVPAAKPFSDMWNASLTASERWQALASIIRRTASLNDILTKGNIGMMQSAMEYLIPSKINKANFSNDRTAQQFLRKLDPDYEIGKSYNTDEIQKLASRAVGYLHGTNDPRTMPEWMMRDSEVSGFFSIAHWSIAQTDRFMRDIYTPALHGNYTPLMMSLFGSVIGGYIIKDLREKLSGKHAAIPSLTEIADSDRGLSGNAGPLAYNMISAMQYSGMGGIFSQIVKYPFDFMYKNIPQGAAFPLDQEVTDLGVTISQVSSAIMNDPNINYVDLAKLVGYHVLTSDFRLSREALYNAINAGLIEGTLAQRKELSDKLGELRRFEQVEGLPFDQMGANSIGENPYMYPEQKSFKREQNLPEAMKQLPGLVQGIQSQWGEHPDVMMQKLKALKQNPYETFPNPDNYPISFFDYMRYLERMKGPEAAQSALQDYLKHKMVNEAKSSAIP